MPSGIASGAWADTPRITAGMNNRLFYNNQPLTYNSSLVSVPPTFNGNSMVSPLSLANQGYYTSSFGRKSKSKPKKKIKEKPKKKARPVKRRQRPVNKEVCNKFLENGGTINPSTGRLLKKDGPVYKSIMRRCEKYSMIPSPSYTSLRNTSIPSYTVPSISSVPLISSAPPSYSLRTSPPNASPSAPSAPILGPKLIKHGNIELNVSADPHYIKIGTRVYTKGVDNANYDAAGNQGRIVGIGPKVIQLSPLISGGKLKRPTIDDFVRFNPI